MPYTSVNPATGQTLAEIPDWDDARLAAALHATHDAWKSWRLSDFATRAAVLARVAELLRQRSDTYARLMATEMGKPIREGRSEIEKCALTSEYYALWGSHFLQDEEVETDASASHVAYVPLGTLLAVMPWNFPFWQVLRAALPALMAGNAVVLKHASSVPRIAQALEALLRDAGLPHGVFATLMISADQVAAAIASPCVHAVTLTGSEAAGRRVAEVAGRHLKKCVLELGGSDAFIVLADADLDAASDAALVSRFQNGGQSCIAAKRIILLPEIAERFMTLFSAKVAALEVGDPLRETTRVGPLARVALRDALDRQVAASIAAGAVPVIGCRPLPGSGAFYAPSILDHVTSAAPAYHEELFGPVAAILRASDEEDALRLANDTRFGLGASVWSADARRAEALLRDIESGLAFVNGVVKSDPRLPFGGVKASGHGRELSYHGMREFVNARALWRR